MIKDNTIKHVDMGQYARIEYSKFNTNTQKEYPIQRLNESEYLVKSTGEIKNYSKKDLRSNNKTNFKKTFQDFRDILFANLSENDNWIFVTLTYRNGKKNTENLTKDFYSFHKKMKRKYGPHEYIYCLELTEKCDWHIHCILIFECKALSISEDDINKFWKCGIANVKEVSDAKGIINYLTLYGLNISKYDEIFKKSKKVTLENYPKNLRLYRYSQGIKKPKINYLNFDDAFEKMQNYELINFNSVPFYNEATNYKNEFYYEFYIKH